jgi:hypothetical protein
MCAPHYLYSNFNFARLMKPVLLCGPRLGNKTDDQCQQCHHALWLEGAF